MIKLMSLGFIGLALLSCSKGDSEPEYQKLLSFNGYTARQATKANGSFVAGNELPTNQAFGVYVYNTGTSGIFNPANISTYGKFMENVKVTYTGGGAALPEKYTYNPMRYWPNSKENNRLAFFAYYPHDGEGITQAEDAKGFADFNFTVQDEPENQVDFMLSDTLANQMYGAAGSTHEETDVVDLTFYHMLTQIRFKGKTDAPSGVTVKVTELSLGSVFNKGTLTPDGKAAESDWTVDETSTTDFVVTVKSNIELSEEAVFIAEDNQTLLMLPQTLSDDSYISVSYSITTTSPARTIKETVSLPLNSLIAEWTRNQQIVYTLNIGMHPIEISASAENWGEDELIIIVE